MLSIAFAALCQLWKLDVNGSVHKGCTSDGASGCVIFGDPLITLHTLDLVLSSDTELTEQGSLALWIIFVLQGKLHGGPSSQPVEPSAADPLPSDLWHQEAGTGSCKKREATIISARHR